MSTNLVLAGPVTPEHMGPIPSRGSASASHNFYTDQAYAGVRTPKFAELARNLETMLMGIFSRTRDIIAANFTDILDRSDDPARMIRVIILEMEETLVEVRASAARNIADQKEMRRHVMKLEALQESWTEKAELALSKDREDLAKAALIERKKAADMMSELKAEIQVLDDALRASEDDIAKLQAKLREARTRQNSIAARLEGAENRIKLRTMYGGERTKDAFSRFDDLERQVDYAEGHAEALGMNGPLSLEDEISALRPTDEVDAELAAMKAALAKKGDA